MPGSNEHKGCKYDCFEESRAYSSHQCHGGELQKPAVLGCTTGKRVGLCRRGSKDTHFAAHFVSKSSHVARAWCCEHAKLGCIKPDESACQLQVPLSRISVDSCMCLLHLSG